MSKIQAENILVRHKGNVIAKLSSVSFEVTRDAIDVTAGTEWAEKQAGNVSWNANTDSFVFRKTTGTNFDELLDELKAGSESVELVFELGDRSGDAIYTGTALLTSLSLTGSTGTVLTYSASFEGDKALNKSFIKLLFNLSVSEITATTAKLSWEVA